MEQEFSGGLSFRDAVNKSLSDTPDGIEILARPKGFYSLLLDNCDPDSRELDIFSHCNDDEVFMQPFLEAARRRSASALVDAHQRGSVILCERHYLSPDHARQLCDALANGIADNLGLTLRLPADRSAAQGAAYATAPLPAQEPPVADEWVVNNPSPQPTTPHTVVSPPVAPVPSSPKAPYTPQKSNKGLLAVVGAVAALLLAFFAFTIMPELKGSLAGGGGQGTAEPTEITVSFETDGGTQIDSEEILKGESITSPVEPTRDGYTFEGWYRNRSLTKSVSFPYTPKHDVTLYAKWEKDTVLDGATDYLRGNGHTYALFDRDADWQSAESMCEGLGGHLATVTSQFEQGIIEDLISRGSRNSYWIGGYLAAPQLWCWVTGEPFSYTRWSEGLPDNWIVEGEYQDATEEERNNIAASENAIIVYRVENPIAPQYPGEWNDLASNGDCNGEEFFGLSNIGYICEWDSLVE